MHILIVDDEASLRRTLRIALESMGHSVGEAASADQALDVLGHRQFDVAFLDLRLGMERGLDLLSSLLQVAPGLPVIIITAYGTIETAVEAMRRGAASYLPKPFTPDAVRLELDRVNHLRRLQTHVDELEEAARARRFSPAQSMPKARVPAVHF
jgi:two-component system, NtrC family, response regulator AlgB